MSDTWAQRGSDLKYGHGSALWTYWTRGEGFAKWSGAAHKWTTLHALLLKAGVPAHSADGLTTNIITAVMPGYMKLAHAQEKKKAGRSTVETTQRAEMTSASINDLPDSEFAYIEAGGKKDASGKTTPRSLRHFPVHDAAHVRNALARAPQSPHGDKAMGKIRSRAKKFGVEVSDDSSSASRMRVTYDARRDCQLEDIHIVRTAEGDSSGRVVEAYATVFDQPVNIRDEQGHYREVIERSAFNDILAQIRRGRGGLPAAVKVLYNHGKTMEGSPAPEFQKPLGKPLFVEPESRGLLTRTEYSKTALAEEVLELIRGGSITAQSFVGACVTSDPELRGPGDKYRARNGALTTVRRMVMGLREYGPVLWAAYTGAEILGVRSQLPGASGDDPDTTLDFDPPADEDDAPDMDGDVTGSAPEDAPTARYHQHALYRMTSEEKRAAIGLTW